MNKGLKCIRVRSVGTLSYVLPSLVLLIICPTVQESHQNVRLLKILHFFLNLQFVLVIDRKSDGRKMMIRKMVLKKNNGQDKR